MLGITNCSILYSGPIKSRSLPSGYCLYSCN